MERKGDVLTARVPAEFKDRVARIARADGRSMSNVVYRLLQTAVASEERRMARRRHSTENAAADAV